MYFAELLHALNKTDADHSNSISNIDKIFTDILYVNM